MTGRNGIFTGFRKSLCRSKLNMVGVEGIEPSTFCSQSRRAKPLRYTPRSLTILFFPEKTTASIPGACKFRTDAAF